MPEPDNCSVKRQLGSTNSKGLPVLFQGSHQGTLLLVSITSMLRTSDWNHINLTNLHKTSSKRGSDPLCLSPFQHVVGHRRANVVVNRGTSIDRDLKKHLQPQSTPIRLLSAVAGATTNPLHAISIATAKGCHSLVVQQTNS